MARPGGVLAGYMQVQTSFIAKILCLWKTSDELMIHRLYEKLPRNATYPRPISLAALP